MRCVDESRGYISKYGFEGRESGRRQVTADRGEGYYLAWRMTRVMSSLWGALEAKASAACMIFVMESLAGSPLQAVIAWIKRSSPHSSRFGLMASLKPSV